jgi:hypothetical protein
VTIASVVTLTNRLTLPYRRGAEMSRVPLGADAGGKTLIPTYDFREYRARYGEDPAAPSYVIAPRRAMLGDDYVLTIDYMFRGASAVTTLTLPAGTFAGMGFVVPLPEGADGTLRLTALTQAPTVLLGAGADAWEIHALLGTIAKTAWIMGREKDVLRRHLDDVRAQRFVTTAHGAGLDAIGTDLRVPRFPPRPHSLDANTVALWHLDERIPDGGAVRDATTLLGIPGHPGVNKGAISGAAGRYASGFAFPGPGGNGAIVVPTAPDFAVTANGAFTIDAFVRANVPGDDVPRVIVTKRLAETVAPSLTPGWSLCVVNARGIAANVQFTACDGTTELKFFADVTVADGRFHHVAGVLDRARGRARLFVDGVQRASVPLGTFGGIVNGNDLRIGSCATPGNALDGIVDEVRFSNVYRTTFHPVLGEDDEAYRARLRIFRRWVLPTPDSLLTMINQAVRINGNPQSFTLIERNKPSATVIRRVRLVPAVLPTGQSIDARGVQSVKEAQTVGVSADERDFEPAYLLTHADPRVTYATAQAALMQAGTALALNALLARITAAGIADQLVLEGAYDPVATGSVRAVGRALLMHHQNVALPPPALAALAHRAGFDYVRTDGARVYAAVERGERLAVRAAPAQTTVAVGGVLDLEVAHFSAHPADAPGLTTPVRQRRHVRVTTDAVGDIVVRVEYRYRGHTQTGTFRFAVTLIALPDGGTLDAFGNPATTEFDAAGKPETDFDPLYLFTHPLVPQIDFSASPDTRRMQVGTRAALDDLIARLIANGTPGQVVVTKGYDAADPGLRGVGRALELRHATLDPGVFGALVAQCFDYVRRQGTSIHAAVRLGAHIEIVQDAGGASLPDELVVGTPIKIGVDPGSLPNTGAYNFSTRAIGNGTGTYDFTQRPVVTFTPRRTGEILLSATYVGHDDAGAAPYTFGIGLSAELDVPATIIPKDQYDIIMNILNAFHPIGIEVTTDRIRSHVVEIEQDPSKAFPAYSFPDFRG